MTVLGRLPHRGSEPSLSTWADETPPQPGRPGSGLSAGLWPNPRVHSPLHPRQRALALGLQRLRKAKQTSQFLGKSNPKSLARHLRGSQGHPSLVTLGDPWAQSHKEAERLRQRKPSKTGEEAKVSTSRGRLEGRSLVLTDWEGPHRQVEEGPAPPAWAGLTPSTAELSPGPPTQRWWCPKAPGHSLRLDPCGTRAWER